MKGIRQKSLAIVFLLSSLTIQQAVCEASFRCKNARTTVEKAICSSPAASAADVDFANMFNKLLNSTNNRAAQVAGQRAWLRYRDASCSRTAVLGPKPTLAATVNCIVETYRLRRAFPIPSDKERLVRDDAIYGMPQNGAVKLDSSRHDWWGIDLTANLHSHDVISSTAYQWLPTGRLLLEVTLTGPVTPQNSVFVDPATGYVVGTYQDAIDLWTAGGQARDRAFSRNGLKLISGNSNPLPLNGTMSAVGIEQCPGPLQHSLRVDTNDKGRITLRTAFVLLLDKKEATIVGGGGNCLGDEGMKWIIDFRSLYPEPVGIFPDDSFLSIFGDRYLIRFRSDLTSNFFRGRSDLVLIRDDEYDPDIVHPQHDNFYSKEPSEQTVEMHKAIENALRHQADARKAP